MSTSFLTRWGLNALALWLTAALIPSISFHGVLALIFAPLVLGIVNAIIRPVILLLTLPINIVTLGLFTFVINAFMLMFTSALVRNFNVEGFWSALLGAVVMSVCSAVLSLLVRD